MKQCIVFCCCVWLGAFFAKGQTVTFTIDLKHKAQTIENIGASGAWYSEGIGKYWLAEKKERMAELLFSKSFDSTGNPLGIGLSAWRFNIGGGTFEQGDSSGIRNAFRRVESFLSPDGTYDWTKQEGYLWFTKKAVAYGVKDLIAFSNTPPVQFTKNGLGFRTQKDFVTNLSDDKYNDYAGFLATVLAHFDKEGIRFNYISPVNEPQWDWSAKFGSMNQEGSPWHNKDIYKIAVKLDSALTAQHLTTKILVTEAGDLTYLYSRNNHASKQLQQFYAKDSKLYIGNLQHLHNVIEGHSYFTDHGDSAIISVRKQLHDTAAKYNTSFWQSEYSMLGDGYKEGSKERRSSMDCALFLAKMIHHDFTIANATAWHFWNAWEPGRAEAETRYNLIALRNIADYKNADYSVTKNLWALGHYSRFVRPGMQRIFTERNDGLSLVQQAQDIMLTAFANEMTVTVVIVNYTTSTKNIAVTLPGVKKLKQIKRYTTSADAGENMKSSVEESLRSLQLSPRSITTLVIDL
ncbi:beta-glycosidase [Lacibacter luteus]|uniref:Beta-glycosidase n=1 Tax=Lacibacter luteus TaxID=2508719 RepID=A0A4Q1CN18_9BACT|nr:glycoside hydrolase [Lacibacter luteus]RXK62194.1 beta-glycosidase [Lacibacter luteus]